MEVKIYYNFTKKCWSVQHKGLVIEHRNTLFLSNAIFKVSEAGRQRVLKEKRKNVHAFICGTLVDNLEFNINSSIKISYNPYKFGYFYNVNTLEKISCCNNVLFIGKDVYTY